MSDIIDRLRNLPYRPMVDYGNGDVRDKLDPDIAEAIDEIERLQELKTPASRQLVNITRALLNEANAEIEQLQAALDRAADALEFFDNKAEAARARSALNATRT